ncbi:Gustatory receptor 144 [Halyomorpha halys]|nr:Gustatory receptor 144 [Halyomorpha halys]
MVQRKPNDVFVEVDKCFLIFKVVGLFTLTYSLGEFTTSRTRLISSVITIWPFLVINSYFACFRWAVKLKTLYGYMGIAQILSVVLCVFLMWLMNSIKFDCFNKCLKKIQLVDYYLISIGEPIPPSKPSKIVILIIALVISMYCLKLPTHKTFYRCFNSFLMYYPYFLMFMVHLLFDRMFEILFLRYQAVTNALRRCLTLQGKKVVVLEKMVFCYECLSSSGEMMNNFFSLQILSILSAVFIISFSEVYAVIHLFYDEDRLDNKKIMFITKLCWSAITFLTIWQFGFRFSTITDKEKLRLHFTMKREVVFTACGLFNLDCTLVHKMIASATTYLVILIQFGQLSSNGLYGWSQTTSSTSYNDTTILPTSFNTSYQD